MARPELGTKRQCQSCAAKFYDLNKTPIVCPKCETAFQLVHPKGARPEPVVEPETPPPQDAELVPLDAADADVVKAADGDVEVEETTEADDTFLEQDEEEGDDVTGLIDGEIEDDEEA